MFAPTVEKYRGNSGKGKGERRQRDRLSKLDALPGREKMSVGSYRRTYSGNCNTIRRWMANQIGRPWNAIYSELCGMAPKGSLERQHLLQQAGVRVETQVEEIDGVLYTKDGYQRVALRPGDLYVRNGILARLPYAPKAKPAPKLAVTFTGQMTGVGQIGGQWFEVTFAEYTPSEDGRYDVFLKAVVDGATVVKAYGRAVVATGKRAMSKTEIKRFRRDR